MRRIASMFSAVLALAALTAVSAGLGVAAEITAGSGSIHIGAGILRRVVTLSGDGLKASAFTISGRELLAQPGGEVAFTISLASPDLRPTGLKPDEVPGIQRAEIFKRVVDPRLYEDPRPNATRWTAARRIESREWAGLVGKVTQEISRPKAGVTRLVLHAPLTEGRVAGVVIDLFYEVYEGEPVIRKWVGITNNSRHWIKIDHLAIDDIRLADAFKHRTPLTPEEDGAEASVMAFNNHEGTHGLILASEIPSALRHTAESGASGYREELFEWVLGPAEKFVSEPCFYYGFAGARRRTVSGVSTPLDRTVEGPYMRFLRNAIGIASDKSPRYAPQWLTWATFQRNINDALVRELANIAIRCGFAQVLLDAGWQRDKFGTEPSQAEFPHFAALCKEITGQGASVGLWVSSYRDMETQDLQALPDARSLPLLRAAGRRKEYPDREGFGMSFASPWRAYFANDLVELARRHGATYFKEDLTDILSGDFAEGHESRSRKESLLRGLRGLLETQDIIREKAPQVVTELTHEIYWGTPGVPADLAALKHASQFHIPPNDCRGEVFEKRPKPSVTSHRSALLLGCWLARQRFYAYRGLPLYPLELYAAATQNVQGSLTPAIQDRQIVSWLMGAPLTFSGDLRSLTPENVAHYRRRFDTLARLQKQYGIYQHFQFSGVPEPTDTGWHWWGKLDDQGYGVVVVLRGSGGEARRAVNVPWVARGGKYHVQRIFAGEDQGVFSGRQLQDRGVPLALPVFGQEILELAPDRASAARR